MKKLIYKSAYFTLPFLISFALMHFFHVKEKGDLLRLAYFSRDFDYEPKVLFDEDFNRKQLHTDVSSLNLNKKNSFDALVLGDSFSDFGPYAYQDYLAEYSGKKILNLNRFLYESPIDEAYRLLNGDFFDQIKVKYLIIQSAERKITQRGEQVIKDQSMSLKELHSLIKADKIKTQAYLKSIEKGQPIQFFSKDVLLYPVHSFYFLFGDRPIFSQAHRTKINKNCFSAQSPYLFFLNRDVQFAQNLCSQAAVEKTNLELNLLQEKLATKGIQLIVLISPDKYDAYYDYIADKSQFPKPTFFAEFDKLAKTYHYINSKKIISDLIKTQKDVYYFGDSHWSPIAAKAMAREMRLYLEK